MPREVFVHVQVGPDRWELVPKHKHVSSETKAGKLVVIKDIEPYQEIATASRRVIGGRRQHREFLRDNDFVEVGNEKPLPHPRDRPNKVDVTLINELKKNMGLL